MAKKHAARAQSFVGTRFRPQGRSRDGLDCVGLVCATHGIPIEGVRRDYRLRGDHREALESALAVYFRQVRRSDARVGDVLLCAAAPEQFHLCVKTDAGFVHAHAGIGRVVETPGQPQWPVIGIYRRRNRKRSN